MDQNVIMNDGSEPVRKQKMKKRMLKKGRMLKKDRMLKKGHMKMAHMKQMKSNNSGDSNPVQYVRTLGHNVITSLTSDTTTTLQVITGANSNDNHIVPILAWFGYVGVNEGSVTCSDSLSRSWTKLAEVSFNTGYLLDLFILDGGVASLPKDTIVTVTHPGSQRRVIMGDEFKGLLKPTSTDKEASAYNTVAATFATSGLTATTTQDKELLYGVIAANGPITDSFTRPTNWSILHDRGTAAGDAHDIRLTNLFRIVGSIGAYEVSGTYGTPRIWASITQTFKANTGGSSVTKD